MRSPLFRRLAATAALVFAVSACTTSTELATPTTVPDRSEVAAVEPTAVAPNSEPTVIPQPTEAASPPPTATPEPTATSVAEPTATTAPTPEPTAEPIAIASTDHSGLAGTRGLTLQWISWEPEDWGTIEFIPLVDGSYAVSGSQTAFNGDTVMVDGTILRVSDRELLFTGEVIVTLDFSNEGQPCVRSGDIIFLATGDRQFWRMQDLLNCDGIITDYVDIYFG